MVELIGMPPQVLFGQLLLGLINGSFYALLSLGLAVIFGMLNVINFAHGALYMTGAFVAYFLLQYLGIGYWPALLLAPLIVGALGIVIEKTMLSRLYKLDHLYGLLLTFGLALIIEGLFRNYYGVSGQPYPIPAALAGGHNLGFMFLPTYRGWVMVASLIVCFGTWFLIERTRLGAYLRAGTENPTLVRAFGINVPAMMTLTYGFGVALAALRRRARGADLPGQPADGLGSDHRGVRDRGDRRHGLDPGLDRDRARARHHRGPDQGVLRRGLEHGDLRDHGDRAADPAGRAVREDALMRVAAPAAAAPQGADRQRRAVACCCWRWAWSRRSWSTRSS